MNDLQNDARELVQAEIALPHSSLTVEQAVLTALTARPGVESASVANGKATVCYDPVQVTQLELSELITRTGGEPAEVHVQRASLLSDLENPPAE